LGDQLEAETDQAVVDLALALELDLVQVLLGQRVLHLLETVVVHAGGVDVAAHEGGAERLAERDAVRDRPVREVGVVDRDVDLAIHELEPLCLGSGCYAAAGPTRSTESRRPARRERPAASARRSKESPAAWCTNTSTASIRACCRAPAGRRPRAKRRWERTGPRRSSRRRSPGARA